MRNLSVLFLLISASVFGQGTLTPDVATAFVHQKIDALNLKIWNAVHTGEITAYKNDSLATETSSSEIREWSSQIISAQELLHKNGGFVMQMVIGPFDSVSGYTGVRLSYDHGYSEHGLKFAKKYSQSIAVLKDVAIKNKNKPVYFSLTVSHLVLKELKNNLFATGLALKYSTSAISNSELIKTNWETKFSKIYLNSVSLSTKEKQLNLNYALPLLQLSRYYNENNMELEKKAIHTIIKQIATGAGKSKEIETLLAKQK